MEFYTLNPNTYARQELIENFESAIWTERFTDPGDFRLVLPATHEHLRLLAPSTLITINDSREVMVIDTRLVEDGAVTASGKSIEAFFDERSIDAAELEYRPGEMLGAIVDLMQAREIPGSSGEFGIGYIPRLRTGTLDATLDVVTEKIELGPVHATLLTLAKRYDLGMSVNVARDDDGDPELIFSTRLGVNHTTNQYIGYNTSALKGELVRFSPELENLANVKELISTVGYKNVVIGHPPDIPGASGVEPVVVTSAGGYTYIENPFDNHILEIKCDDITEEKLGGPGWSTLVIRILMYNQARDVLLKYKKTKSVDGEVTSETQYQYGTHYKLGDLVEMEGYFGNPIQGAVTEYIRSQDATGIREYPTVQQMSPEVFSS